MCQLATSVLMPKAAMHKDNFTVWPKNEIGPSGKIIPVQPITIAETMHEPPYKHLRLHARAANGTHIRTTIHDYLPSSVRIACS